MCRPKRVLAVRDRDLPKFSRDRDLRFWVRGRDREVQDRDRDIFLRDVTYKKLYTVGLSVFFSRHHDGDQFISRTYF